MKGIEMNVIVFDYFHNTVVFTVILISARTSDALECIHWIPHQRRHLNSSSLLLSAHLSCLCKILYMCEWNYKKHSSWYVEHVNGKLQNGILIWSCIVTLKYPPSYVWQDPLDSVQYNFNYLTSLLVKPVYSAHDSGWVSLGYWMLGSRKYSRTKDSVCSCNQRI